MVRNYWLKQGFFAVLFLLCEFMIALSLLSSRSYLGLIMWALHPWPLMFVIYNIKTKIKEDIMSFADMGLNSLFDKIKNPNTNEEVIIDETGSDSSD